MRTIQHNALLQAFAKEKARENLNSKFGTRLLYYICILVMYIFIMLSLILKKYMVSFLVLALLSLVIAIILLLYQGKVPVNKYQPLIRKLTIRNKIFKWLVSDKKYSLRSIKKLRGQIETELNNNKHVLFGKKELRGQIETELNNNKHVLLKKIIILLFKTIGPTIIVVPAVIREILDFYIFLFLVAIIMILYFIYDLVRDDLYGNTYYEYILSILDSIIFDLENTGDNIPGKIKIEEIYREELKELKQECKDNS
ncbi:MAG: hypothetical protein ABF695_12365 [Liquorilactobacillus ghanensis]|uniref:hypothetical protein n=1 Tax=Liquorilactobacillus ghanensis TaxID=399370 RepID=UPI0039EA3D13